MYRTVLALLLKDRRGQVYYREYRDLILFLNPVSPSGNFLAFNA
jgi:hypothetical protein